MFGWRARRRLIYLFLTLLVLSGLAGFFYWLNRPVPTCFDSKRNQGELGVDCGGPCEKVCPFEVKDLRVIWGPRIFEVAPGRYDAAVLVQNPNPRHAVRSLKYLIKVFDRDNLLVTTRRGNTFLNPQETFPIFESRLAVGRRTPSRAVFELAEAPLWQRITEDLPRLVVERQTWLNEPSPKLTAVVANPTLSPLTDIVVVVVLLDKLGNALAVSSTLVEELRPGERREIVYTWPRPFEEEAALSDFYVHFDISGFGSAD